MLSRLIRLSHLPLSDRRISLNTYYSNFDAAKMFDKADRPSLHHILGRPYAASNDEYSVVLFF